nr:uncharacterized protein LOC114820042 [Malus domestica]
MCFFFLSKEHKHRLQCYYTEPVFLSDIFDIPRYRKSSKYLQPNRWLQSWWRREIQALMQEEDVDIVMHHIHGVINSSLTRDEQKGRTTAPEEKQREFQESTCDAAGPFLAARTNRFVNEVELFLASGLKIEAYDAVCMQRLGWSAPGVTTKPAEVELAEHRPVIPYLYIFFYYDRSE